MTYSSSDTEAKGIEAAPRIAELPANPSQPFLKRGPFRIRALEKMFHSFYSLRGLLEHDNLVAARVGQT